MNTANWGSWRWAAAFAVRFGGMTWTDASSSPSSHRLVSISWMIESVIVMKLVNESGTVGLRWTLWRISASPIAPPSSEALTCR